MPTSIVVGGIFLSSDELLWMKELSVRSLTNFVDDGRFQVNEDGARHVLAYKRRKTLIKYLIFHKGENQQQN